MVDRNESFGRHQPPATVRVAEETEYSDETISTGDGLADAASFVERSLARTFGTRRSPTKASAPSLADQLAGMLRDPLDKAAAAAEEMVLCGKRSLDHVTGKARRGGEIVVRKENVKPL